MFDRNGRLITAQFGYDPYNTTTVLRLRYNGPLTAVAYREQASWDFTPGTQADKLAYWHQHGMHRLPLRPMASVPGLLRRQAS
jgi:hypothetical protein